MLKAEGSMIKIIFNRLFVYSQSTDKYFFTKFSLGFNIVYGRNTSGKSTLIQSIIYSMGINDSKENLNEIFRYDPVFRLDCEIIEGGNKEKVIFVRSDDTIVVKVGTASPLRFDGINGNNSYEYDRYKHYFSNIINFKLKLQNKNELVAAPLESAVLPFYISQSVGWVYIRESIGDYRFYKDFRFDYLDYYTGLSSNKDRVKRNELIKDKKQLKLNINQVKKYKSNNTDIAVAEALNKRYKDSAIEYLKRFSKINHDLVSEERKHSQLCNDLTSLKMRQRVLNQVSRNIKNQEPQVNKCPTCEQILPGGVIEYYQYSQDINDALKEKENVAVNIKKKSALLNSTDKKLLSIKSEINVEYEILTKFNVADITFDTWLDYHANLKIIEKINDEVKSYNKDIDKIDNDIADIDSDDLNSLRRHKDRDFLKILRRKTSVFNVQIPDDNRYKELYSITSFPLQGVELHKMIMAYHFSFLDFISKNNSTHMFPFMLDAVFKEDIDTKNRGNILEFISSEANKYDQVIFTIAEIKDDNSTVSNLFNTEKLNNTYFSNKATLICIGKAKNKKSFLSSINFKDTEYIDETLNLLEVY
jgi:hypothetical protein